MANYLDVPSGGSASAPNVAGFNGTQGPFEFIMELTPVGSWAVGGGSYPTLLGAVSQGGRVDRHSIYLNPSGQIEWYWNNSAGATLVAQSTASVPFASATTGWVRGVLTLAAGTCDFYTSTNGSSWTTLGTQVTGLTTTALSSAGTGTDFRIGYDTLAGDNYVGRILSVKFLANSVTLYEIDWKTATVGGGPWTGADTLTWTAAGGATVATAGGGGGGSVATTMLLAGAGG